jgi:hypothetical protein
VYWSPIIKTIALVALLASSLVACASAEGDATDEAAGAASTAFSSHGLSGPIAVISDGHTMSASVRQGRCEFTMVGYVGAHAIADRAEIWTANGLVGHAVVEINDEHTLGFQTTELPAGCETVFNKAAVARGTRYNTTVALNKEVIGFRTVLAEKTYFRNGFDLSVPGDSYVIKGQTLQIFNENGTQQEGYVLSRYTPANGSSTVGFIVTDDLSPAEASE